VLGRRIARRPVDGTDRPLTGHAALQLRADFFGIALLKRIGAAAGEESDSKQEDEALHLLILGGECRNASGRQGGRG
jgi:hypothetical protein